MSLFIPIFITIVLVFVIPALALKGFVLYSALLTFAYTIYTIVIYTSYDLIVINLVTVIPFWMTVVAGFTQRKWARIPTSNK